MSVLNWVTIGISLLSIVISIRTIRLTRARSRGQCDITWVAPGAISAMLTDPKEKQ